MHTPYKTGMLALALFVASCGQSPKVENAKLTDLKVEIEKLKKERDQIEDKLSKAEKELIKLDPSLAKVQKPKLVGLSTIAPGNFSHFIDLQGKIDAEDISYVTPRGMGGQVRELYVRQGDVVKKGQLLLRLDDALVRQQIESVKVQLGLAKDLYQRQNNLWKQNIGTEVQLLTAKNNVESLEKQIATLQEQLSMSNVYAQVNGVADEVTIRVGETFTGSPMAGYIKIVNTSRLKAMTLVPENYLSKVNKGTPVKIVIPDLNKEFSSTITRISQSIINTTGGFTVEAKIPSDPALKPNMIALIKIQDYASNNALAVPIGTVQNDEKGKYVLVAADEKGKMVARKRAITTGEVYGDLVEIKSGLQAGDQLITDGYQSLYDGQPITTSAQ